MIGHFYIGKYIPAYTATSPLAGAKARTMGSGNALPVAAEPAAFPTAELFLAVAKADESLAAVMTAQTVGLSATGLVPPYSATMSGTEGLWLFAWDPHQRLPTIFTDVRIWL